MTSDVSCWAVGEANVAYSRKGKRYISTEMSVGVLISKNSYGKEKYEIP
jgi:hypothetical protein